MSRAAEYESELRSIMLDFDERREVIHVVSGQGLGDCWVAAGFVRNTVWDYLHGHRKLTPLNDVDVAYFDPVNIDRNFESRVEQLLRARLPGLAFSVKNQARMHRKNGHRPYTSAEDAISRWTETCTAVGVRWRRGLDICAPHGLIDLFSLIVRPTSYDQENLDLVRARIWERQWLSRWPRLRVDLVPPHASSPYDS